MEKLRVNGHEAFFAGGCVRDFLLRRKPQDIDIATSATPDAVQKLFASSMPIGAQFGVVQVRMYGHSYDVATFRSEGPYIDGRHPSSVTFSGPRQDALRRDFTVNGMFYDPIANRVIDYVHGRVDLQRKVLRTIGKPAERFAEDKLRMLRAIRLAGSLGFEIANETWETIQRLAPEILKVSWERIRDELLKILTGPDPARGLDLTHRSRLLAHILPEVEAMRGVPQPPEFHPEGDVFDHTRRALSLLRKPSAVLAMGTLLHDVGKPPTFAVKERIRFDGHVEVGVSMAYEICHRLRISTNDTEQIVDLVREHLRFMSIGEMRESTLRRFLQKEHFADHLELHRVDCLASHGDLDGYRFCLERLEQLRQEPPPVPHILTGNDLIRMGYEPGPIFGEILRTVEDLQLEGRLESRELAEEYVKSAFPLPRKDQP